MGESHRRRRAVEFGPRSRMAFRGELPRREPLWAGLSMGWSVRTQPNGRIWQTYGPFRRCRWPAGASLVTRTGGSRGLSGISMRGRRTKPPQSRSAERGTELLPPLRAVAVDTASGGKRQRTQDEKLSSSRAESEWVPLSENVPIPPAPCRTRSTRWSSMPLVAVLAKRSSRRPVIPATAGLDVRLEALPGFSGFLAPSCSTCLIVTGNQSPRQARQHEPEHHHPGGDPYPDPHPGH